MMVKRPLIAQEYGGEYQPLWPLLSGFVPPAVLAAAYFILRGIPGVAQKIIDGFAFPVRQFLSGLSSHVPFSLMEVLYVVFGLWVVFFLVRSIVLICRGHRTVSYTHLDVYKRQLYGCAHVLLMGRVMSGKGGDIVLDVAKKVIADEYPEIVGKINPALPDEKSRRVGQSVAAASLPELK